MSGPLFTADAEDWVSQVQLDGLSLLFHAPSGMTHIVAPPAPEILAALRIGPAAADQLLARIQARFDLEDEAGVAAIEARLEELEAAGLVTRL